MTDQQRSIVISRNGSFGLSRAAVVWLREHGYELADQVPVFSGEKDERGREYDPEMYEDWENFFDDVPRDLPLLITCVQELGTLAYGSGSVLKVVHIPMDVDWQISEDGESGSEWVSEKHRTWH